jgi:hypothetical protein
MEEKNTTGSIIFFVKKNIIRSAFLTSFSVLLYFYSLAQCFTKNNAFGDGENITYEVSYNWGPIWMDAGLVNFMVSKEKYFGKDAWHLKSTGKTYTGYDYFFKVRDYYNSWIDPQTFHSIEFKRYIYEGNYNLLNTITFDLNHQIALSHTKSNNNPLRKDTIRLSKCIFDMLSSVYFTRTLNLSDLKPEARIPVSIIIDDSVYSIVVRSLGKEVIENMDGQRYKCIKFTAKMVQGTIFRGNEDALIWITDDENKIPVYIEAKIIVGSVKAYLIEAKGLKNPIKALIK